ncbi:TPA: hypothetical protein VGT23_001381 [Vibrio cholerae]|nr:hypothetical protein [Vibrio cholerae]HEQ3577815.1 hypothetical protein [Vibrio cholerae]
MTIYMFNSLEEVKAVAEKFEAGKIVPNRVLKVQPKKVSHLVVFYCDSYRLRGADGFDVFFCDFDKTMNKSESSPSYTQGPIHIKRGPLIKYMRVEGKTHGKSGNKFFGNVGISDDECLLLINQAVFGKKAVEV